MIKSPKGLLNPRPFFIGAGFVLVLWMIASFYFAWFYVDWQTKQAVSEAQRTQQQTLSGSKRGLRRVFDMSLSALTIAGHYPSLQNVLSDSEHAKKRFLSSEESADLLNVRNMFFDIVKMTDHIHEIWLIDQKGTLLISGASLAKRAATDTLSLSNHRNADYFKAAMNGVSDMYFLPALEGRQASLFTSTPVYDEKQKEVLGVLVIRTALSFLNPWINNGAIWWIDKYGVVFRSTDVEHEGMRVLGSSVEQLDDKTRETIYGNVLPKRLPLVPIEETCAPSLPLIAKIQTFFCTLGIPDALEGELFQVDGRPRLYTVNTESVEIGDFALMVGVSIDYIGSRMRYIMSIFLVSCFVSTLLIGLVTSLLYYSQLSRLFQEKIQLANTPEAPK